MCVNLGAFVNLHLLLLSVSIIPLRQVDKDTYHLEVVKLFFDLLSQHGSQTIARRDITATIILLTRPGLEEHDARTKRRAPLRLLPRRSVALFLAKTKSRHKVVLVPDGNRLSTFRSLLVLAGRARGTRAGRIRIRRLGFR